MLRANVESWPEHLHDAGLLAVVLDSLEELVPEALIEGVVADVLAPGGGADGVKELLEGGNSVRLVDRIIVVVGVVVMMVKVASVRMRKSQSLVSVTSITGLNSLPLVVISLILYQDLLVPGPDTYLRDKLHSITLQLV